jgi:YVTN family beta-propeller protein
LATESPPYAPDPEASADPVPIASPAREPSGGSMPRIGGEPNARRPPPPWSEAIVPSPFRAKREHSHRRARLRVYCRCALAVAVVGAIVLPKEPRGLHPPVERSRSAEPVSERKPAAERKPRKPDSSSRRLALARRIGGEITPKSVASSGTGLVFAQNMMYRHSVTVYDRRFRLIRTIPDSVRLGTLGFGEYRGATRGAPVEAAFSPDGRYGYVSNYSMSGPGFHRPGDDVCSPSQGFDRSFLFRIPLSTLRVDKATRVGAVPKYVAATPDGRYVLVTNWCSWDMSVVDARSGRSVRNVRLGPYPRGIAVDPRTGTAYVAVMGARDVAAVDLSDFSVSWIRDVGAGPRHLVIGSRGRYLYATLNEAGRVAKIDVRRRRVVAAARTGSAPRSAAIAPDGRSVYVVNYRSNTVSKIRTSDMRVVQTVKVDKAPIGITYDEKAGDVWVACYSGSIMVFKDA